jgi:hypothetical protein
MNKLYKCNLEDVVNGWDLWCRQAGRGVHDDRPPALQVADPIPLTEAEKLPEQAAALRKLAAKPAAVRAAAIF